MEILLFSREHSTNRQRRSKMVSKRHMHKMMLQILKESEMVINDIFKVKNLNIHTYREELVKEICTRARMYAIEAQTEEEPTISTSKDSQLQEVLDDILSNDDDIDKERCEEMVQALSTIMQDPVDNQIEEEAMKTQESIEIPDFQTVMEMSLDNKELKDNMLVHIPFDYISS